MPPAKFKSEKELQEKIDAFFQQCDDNGDPYTITGLALALDTTRETLCDYEHKDGYSDTVKRAKLRCQNFAEKRLFGNNCTGAIFALKNYGWKDKTDIEHSGHITATKEQRDAAVSAALMGKMEQDK